MKSSSLSLQFLFTLILSLLAATKLQAGMGSPSPQIFEIVPSTGLMVPAAVHLSALPSFRGQVSALPAFTPGLSGCGLSLDGKDIELAKYTYFQGYTLDQQTQLANCLRKRDRAYETRNSQTYLGGGSSMNSIFDWNFGDPAGRYNQVRGFNASHVYDKAGSYTVTLTITNEGGYKASTTKMIQIGADTRPSLYVDSVFGNDNYPGTLAKPLQTIDRVLSSTSLANNNSLGCGKNIYFKRGGTYTAPQVIYPTSTRVGAGLYSLCSGTHLGAYGSGKLPIIQMNQDLEHAPSTNSYLMFLSVNPGSAHILIEDLQFQIVPGSDPNRTEALQNAGLDVVLRRVTTGRLKTLATTTDTSAGFLMIDNGVQPTSFTNWPADPLIGLMTYVGGTRGAAFYGNSFHIKQEVGEPTFRSCGTTTELISFVDNKIKSNVTNKLNPIAIRNGRQVYLGNNRVDVGHLQIGNTCNPGGTGSNGVVNYVPNEAVSNVVIENNFLQNVYLGIWGGDANIRASNNLSFRTAASADLPLPNVMNIEVDGTAAGKATTENIYIYGNTFYFNQSTNRWMNVSGVMPGQLNLYNNIFATSAALRFPVKAGIASDQIESVTTNNLYQSSKNVFLSSPADSNYLWGFHDRSVMAGDWSTARLYQSRPTADLSKEFALAKFSSVGSDPWTSFNNQTISNLVGSKVGASKTSISNPTIPTSNTDTGTGTGTGTNVGNNNGGNDPSGDLPKVASLALVNVHTMKPMVGFENLSDGMTYDWTAAGKPGIAILAVLESGESVKFSWLTAGAASPRLQTESSAPLLSGGDNTAMPIAVGPQLITVQPFGGKSGTGTVGKLLQIHLQIK